MIRFLAFVICLTALVPRAQESPFSDKIWLDGKVLNTDSTLYSGLLFDYWPSGKTKRTAKVENGLITGNTKEFYETGQLRFIKQFRDGKLVGMITEYFPNGELKMQAEIGSQSRMGGNELTNFLYAYYTPEGEYINKVKAKVRIVLMTSDKLSNFYNDQLPLHLQDAYRIFDNSKIDYGIFIEDSRDLKSPELSNHIPMPVKKVKSID